MQIRGVPICIPYIWEAKICRFFPTVGRWCNFELV